jgi:predicted Rossmann fold nucleotide-binding protein DprA/Smf involved in DNA uptake
VPGPIDDPRSAGCLTFYREYPEVVRLVAGIPELIADLGLDRPASVARTATARTGHGVRRRPLSWSSWAPRSARAAALTDGHTSIDELVAATGHEPATVLGAITLLEMRGLAPSTNGRYRAAGRLATLAPTMRTAGSGGHRRRWPSRTTVLAAAGARGLPGRPGPC